MIGAIYLTTLSVVLATMGLIISYNRIILFFFGLRATGRFVRWEQRGIRKIYFHPVVSFHAKDGQTYEFVGGPGSRTKYQRAAYRVLYPPEQPEKAMTHCFLSYWAAPFGFFILSLASGYAALHQ